MTTDDVVSVPPEVGVVGDFSICLTILGARADSNIDRLLAMIQTPMQQHRARAPAGPIIICLQKWNSRMCALLKIFA